MSGKAIGRGRGRGKAPATSPAPPPVGITTTAPVPKARGRGRGQKSENNDPCPNTPSTSPRPSTSSPSVESPRPHVESPRLNVECPSRNSNVKPSRPRGRGKSKIEEVESSVGNLRISNNPPNAIKLRFDENGRPINPFITPKSQLVPLHRKDYGTHGKEIKLIVNYHQINYKSSVQIHQYDIQMEVSEKLLKDDKNLALSIFLKMIEEYSQYFEGALPVYDGQHIMYSNKKLPIEKTLNLSVTYKFNETRTDCINITVQPTSMVIDFNDLQEVYDKKTQDLPHHLFSCVDIILGYMPKLKYMHYGRNFFPKCQNTYDLGNGVQLWSGTCMSVKPGQWKLLINIDEKHTAFYKSQSLIDFVKSVYPNPRFSPQEKKQLTDHLKGLKIETNHLGYPRRYRICGLSECPDKKMITNNTTSETLSVSQYFMNQYQKKLQFGHFPCLQVEPANRDIFIPMELGTILEGQRCIRKLSEKQVADIIKKSAKKPNLKQSQTSQQAAQLFSCSQEYITAYGLEVDTQPMKIKGRVLPAPAMLYNGTKTETPRQGAWRSSKLSQACSLNNWAFVSMSPMNRVDAKTFYNEIVREGQNFGIKVDMPKSVQYINPDRFKEDVSKMLAGNPQINYIFVVLPERTNNEMYSMVKELESDCGVITQCIKLDTATKRFKGQTVGNVLLKTNAKLGGVNWLVKDFNPVARMGGVVFSEPVMIIGADVTHWARGEGVGKPSIAGVVCTLDQHCSRYAARISLQQHAQGRTSDEIIRDFQRIIEDLLITYRKVSGKKPGKILYYRDGVSAGQFISTLTEEMAGIQAACKALEEGFEPKITYINAQKRHHTRLFCGEQKDADRSGNVPAGTVVDREITNPVHFDFFLNSHSGIQGTNRPCHYTVLWDDSDLAPDLIQLLTFYLCHTYARCSRSVSYPAPTYYAHLLCARARTMLSAQHYNWHNPNSLPPMKDIEAKLTQNESLKNITYFV